MSLNGKLVIYAGQPGFLLTHYDLSEFIRGRTFVIDRFVVDRVFERTRTSENRTIILNAARTIAPEKIVSPRDSLLFIYLSGELEIPRRALARKKPVVQHASTRCVSLHARLVRTLATHLRVQIHRSRAGTGDINIVYFVNAEYTSRCFNVALALLASCEIRSRGRCRNSRAIFLCAHPRSPFQRRGWMYTCAHMCIGNLLSHALPAIFRR